MNRNGNSGVAAFSAVLVARHAKAHFRGYILFSRPRGAARRSCPRPAAGYGCARTGSPARPSAAGRPRPRRPSCSDFTGRRAGRTGPAPVRLHTDTGPLWLGQPAAPTAPARRRGNEPKPEPEPGPSPATGRDGEAGARALGPSPVRDPAPGSGLDATAAPAALT